MFKNFGANFILFLMSDTFIFTITHLLHQAQMARQAEQDLMSLYIVNLPHSVKESHSVLEGGKTKKKLTGAGIGAKF